MPARSLVSIISAVVTLLLGSTAIAAANASGSSRTTASRPADTSDSNGSVNHALNRLYRIPRNNRPQPPARGSGQVARPSAPARITPAGANRNTTAAPPARVGQPAQQQLSIHDRDRMGLQHSDAIRNSVSSLPIGDDLRRPPGDGHIVPNTNRDPAVRRPSSLTAYACGPYIDAYYNSYPGQRLPSNVRDWTDYNYFDGEPSRYGYGHYNNMYGIGDSPQGEYFRFGFMEGYQRGQWHRESDERVQSVIAHATTHMGRGLAAFRGGLYREAAKYFKLASEMNQGDPSAMIYAAHALFAVGRYQEGNFYLRKAFTLEPRIALLTYDMRDDYGNKQDFAVQLAALQSAADAAPGNIDRLAMLAYIFNFTAQPDRAYQVLTKARKISPNDKVVKLLYEASNPPDIAK